MRPSHNERGAFTIAACFFLIGLLVLAFWMERLFIAARGATLAQRMADAAAKRACQELAQGLNVLAKLNILLLSIERSVLALQAVNIATAGAATPKTATLIASLLRAANAIARLQNATEVFHIGKTIATLQQSKKRREYERLRYVPFIPLVPKELPTTLHYHITRRRSRHPGLPGVLMLENHFKSRQILRLEMWVGGARAVSTATVIGPRTLLSPRWRSEIIANKGLYSFMGGRNETAK